MKPVISAYCLLWHKENSKAFEAILLNQLSSHMTVRLFVWDDITILDQSNQEKLLFLQIIPPIKLLSNPLKKVIWIPMWDHVQSLPDSWWTSLPKGSLRIIAYSARVAEKADRFGIESLNVKYYPDPHAFPKVSWKSKKRTLMYWNRFGLISPQLLITICNWFNVSKMIYFPRLDRGAKKEHGFYFPKRVGNVFIQSFDKFIPEQQYRKLLNESQIFISPRRKEGVGLTFLEAMASGCAVLAYDDSTMNEYIQHKENGFLLKRLEPIKNFMPKAPLASIPLVYREKPTFSSWLNKVNPLVLANEKPFMLGTRTTNLNSLFNIEPEKLGYNARTSVSEGHALWANQVDSIINFIIEW